MKIDLYRSPVVFDEGAHTYTLNGKSLRGITGVLKENLFPDEYRDVSPETLRRAADKGHRVHSAIELFLTMGITTEECPELDAYRQLQNLHPWLRNDVEAEYLVSDEEQYASCIDHVYTDAMGGVNLADVKTTYALNEEYVSWQLSVYAYLFEEQNLDIPVHRLYAIWLRQDKAKLVEVQRKSREQVQQLLYGAPAEVHRTDIVTAETLPAVAEAEAKLVQLKNAADEAKAKYDELREGLTALMDETGAKKYDGTLLTMTRKADATREGFDAKAFKKDYPELYQQYLVISSVRGGVQIKIK